MAPSTRRAKGKKPEKVEVSEEDQKPGVIYVGHVPHGFYEDQMRAYFKQFGDVLAVKVSRSKTSGNSKGYAFVKFRYAAVAKTVAETCNNYLFFTRLLKCSYRPAEEVHRDTFKRHPKKPRRKEKRLHNADKSEADIKMADKTALKKMRRKMKCLSEAGISLDLDEVLSTPSKEKIDESKTKPTKQTKDKTPKKRKRSENDDSEAEQINGNIRVKSDGEDQVQPTPKRRKKSSPNTPEKIDVEIVKKTKTPPGKKAESLIKKTPESKVLTPGKKAASLIKKTPEPKVATPGKRAASLIKKTPEPKVATPGKRAASLIKKTPEPKVATPGKRAASLIKKTPESKVATPGKRAASLIKKTPEPKVATPGRILRQSSAKKDKVVVPTGVKKSPGSGKKKK